MLCNILYQFFFLIEINPRVWRLINIAGTLLSNKVENKNVYRCTQLVILVLSFPLTVCLSWKIDPARRINKKEERLRDGKKKENRVRFYKHPLDVESITREYVLGLTYQRPMWTFTPSPLGPMTSSNLETRSFYKKQCSSFSSSHRMFYRFHRGQAD